MIQNEVALQNRIDSFLAYKRTEIPELDQSVDAIYRQLAQEVREERQGQFPKVTFGQSMRERTLSRVPRSHRHSGGLHFAV